MAETFHNFLSRVALFQDLTDPEIDELLRITNRVRMKPGDVVTQEGDEGDSLYIIREGVVQVKRRTSGGEIVIARLSEGEVIGEMALIDGAPRSASLVAETAGTLYQVRRDNLDILKSEMSPAAYKILRAIALICCERLRDINTQIQHYIENPATLFEPEVKTGTTEAKGRVSKFLNLFGIRGS